MYASAQPLEPSTRAVMGRIRARIIANMRLQGTLAALQVSVVTLTLCIYTTGVYKCIFIYFYSG